MRRRVVDALGHTIGRLGAVRPGIRLPPGAGGAIFRSGTPSQIRSAAGGSGALFKGASLAGSGAGGSRPGPRVGNACALASSVQGGAVASGVGTVAGSRAAPERPALLEIGQTVGGGGDDLPCLAVGRLAQLDHRGERLPVALDEQDGTAAALANLVEVGHDVGDELGRVGIAPPLDLARMACLYVDLAEAAVGRGVVPASGQANRPIVPAISGEMTARSGDPSARATNDPSGSST